MVAPMNVRVYTACAGMLLLKFVVILRIQAGKSGRAGGRPPEDELLISNPKAPKQMFYGVPTDIVPNERMKAKQEDQARWLRIVMNELESVPLALLIFAGGVLADANPKVHAGAMITYTVARSLHTIAYAYALQPHRMISFAIGLTSVFVGAGNAIYGAFF